MKEKDLQKLIVKSVQEQGGKAAKLQGAFTKGISDLYLLLPEANGNWLSLLCEVKYLGEKRGEELSSIKLPLSAMQWEFVRDFEELKPYSAVVLSGVYIAGTLYLYASPPSDERLFYHEHTRVESVKQLFDIRQLFVDYKAIEECGGIKQLHL
jgi:hypothetical protein